jgi:hypothetical protein
VQRLRGLLPGTQQTPLNLVTNEGPLDVTMSGPERT